MYEGETSTGSTRFSVLPGAFRIGTAARLSGISVATLRNWESRYGLIVARRNESGHRVYTRDEVERLRWIKRHLDRGLSPAEAHELLRDQLDGDKPAAATAVQKLVAGTQETVLTVSSLLAYVQLG